MPNKYKLSTNIVRYIKTIAVQYQNSQPFLYEVLSNCRVYAHEYIEPDNPWDNIDHNISLFLSAEILSKISSSKGEAIAGLVKDELNKFDIKNGDRKEYIAKVSLELFDEENEECRKSLEINIKENTPALPDPGIWQGGFFRLFISHRDVHKKEVSELSSALEKYDFSCFVAHEDIKPSEEWQKTILSALQTMNILLAFVTNDFFESEWTNQEIGFALGKDIPILSLKLEGVAPLGFINQRQALPCKLQEIDQEENIYKISDELKKLIFKEKPQLEDNYNDYLINKFIESKGWHDIPQNNFGHLKENLRGKLNVNQVNKIIENFNVKGLLYGCYYLTNSNRLASFLEEQTGISYIVKDKKIIPQPVIIPAF